MKILAPLLRRLGYAPIRSHTARRDFPAAESNRLTADWRTSPISLDSLLMSKLDSLCARAEDLQGSNEYFQKFLTMVKTNVLGDSGMALKNKATWPINSKAEVLKGARPDKLANALVESAFKEWSKKENCTVAKDMTWLQVQQLALETVAVRGETLWRKVYGAEARNKFGFALQPIAGGRIDTARNENLKGGGKIRLGVEFNARGVKVAYWLRDSDPADSILAVGNWQSKRYDADQFVHPKIVRQIGQSRGFPWAAAPMLRLKMLEGYDVATVEGARAAACKMGFFTKTGTGVEYTGENAEGGGKYSDAEPGMLEELPQGMDVKVVDWNTPGEQYKPFTDACKQGIACGLSMSYPRMFGDYASINFSAGKLAQSDDDRVWCFLQSFFATEFHDAIFPDFLEAALLTGNIGVKFENGGEIMFDVLKFEQFNKPTWRPPSSAWFDPKKEAEANEIELANGLVSPLRIHSEREQDVDEVIEETKEYLEKIQAAGLPMPRWALPPTAAQSQEKPDAKENVKKI